MDKKLKKAGILLLVYLFICFIRLLSKDSMINEVNTLIESKLKNFIISAVSDNMGILGFIHSNSSSGDFDLYEKLGQNTGYFAYLTEEKREIELVLYDPNSSDKSNLYYSGQNENGGNPLTGNMGLQNGAANNSSEGNTTDNEITEEMLNANNGSIVYSKEQLSDFNFLYNNLYVVTERAKLLESDLNIDELLNIDNTIKGGNSAPQILIYHTHSHEEFADTTGVNTSNIVAVGTYLAEVLSKEYGYNVIHCIESFDEVNGVFDRSKAYTYATPALEQILKDNPSIEVVLDIHRDGLKEGSPKLLTYINGKATAKIMFFNGISRNSNGEIGYLYNQYRKENLALSLKMKLKAMELYPDFTRNNYVDAYQYNLHLRANSMLIEVGAQNNTFEEAKNAMEPLAEILDKILKGE